MLTDHVQGHGGVSGIESDIAVFSDSLDTHPEQSLQSVMDCIFGKPECLKNLTTSIDVPSSRKMKITAIRITYIGKSNEVDGEGHPVAGIALNPDVP